ncbi:alpha/beta hydrolase [Caproicibacter sp.]|uniref:alpha/beta hydrolase n=1 Tax=Caproicibacter sp. TaxID=2814884 RepID=UPI003989B8CD
MRKKKKIIRKILVSAVGLVVLFLLSMTIFNQIMLTKESKWIKPNGTFVTVDGYKMHVYTVGPKENRPTILILSAFGTAAPGYDYKVLYSKLSSEYHIVVVEKFGYGYSDISGLPRDVGTIVKEYREALRLSNENGPFVLMPHSMSGLEALYWAQHDPNEVSAIVGLDMSVPEYYRFRDHNPITRFLSSSKFLKALVSMGLDRIPGVGLISDRSLTKEEFAQNQYLTYKMLLNKDVLAESDAVKSNAQTVQKGGMPNIPMLLFSSNGTGLGEKWVQCERSFARQSGKIKLIQLDCSHMIQYFKSADVAQETKLYLQEIFAE